MSSLSVIELLDFARAARVPDGFGSLDADGVVDPAVPVSTLVTARMTYSFATGSLLGIAGSAAYAAHGVTVLLGPLHDAVYGGHPVMLGQAPGADRKGGYQHAFVLLAAAAASRAEVPGAGELLQQAVDVFESRFWSDDDGAVRESWDRRFERAEPYWGANANMHAVEAMIATAGVTRDSRWLARAARVAERFIDGYARQSSWMLGEHYDERWTPLPDYNRDRPADEFRPYGVTVGHLFEWARLLVELQAAQASAAEWMVPAAQALYATARRVGWFVDGGAGFVYTVDTGGAPVVRHRPHWVIAEAIAAAVALAEIRPGAGYDDDARLWADHVSEYFVDPVGGSWHHGLDEANRPSSAMWAGKPDIYHALTATQAIDRLHAAAASGQARA